jgi:hypothetical protein
MLRRLGRRADPFFLLSLLLTTFALYPLWANPGLPVTSDGLLQPYRLVELDAALQAQYWYPRWAPNFWLGNGYPFFNFYAPASFYLAEVFHLLGASFETAMRLLVILSTLVAAGAAYALGRDLYGSLGGLVVSAVYVHTPHMLTEIYRRGDYPQLLALGLLPLVLWSNWRWAQAGERRWLLISALSLAALLLSHSVTAMLFAPVYALWLLLLLWLGRGALWSSLWRIVTANLLGMGLSLFFWLPAIAERPLVQTHRLLTGHFDFRSHFLSVAELLAASPWPDPRILNEPVGFGLGQAPVALAAAGLLALLWAIWRKRGGIALVAGAWALATVLVSILMTLPLSAPLYNSSDFLALTQFPWRWLGIAGLGLAVLAGAAVTLIPPRWPVWAQGGIVAALLGIILVAIWPETYPVTPFDRYTNLTVADITRFELERGPMGTSSASEFLPRWVKTAPGRSPMVDELLAGRMVTKPDLGPLPPGVRVSVLNHTPTQDEAMVDAPQGFGMLFRTLYFPGWRAWIDGEPVEIIPYETYGYISFPVPAGQHRVLVRFEDTPVRWLSQWASLAALLALAGLLAVAGRLAGLFNFGAPTRNEERSTPGLYGWRVAGSLALGFLLLLSLRQVYVDPQTSWFRQETAMVFPDGGPTPFGGKMLLAGYRLEPEKPTPGQVWNITLFWQGLEPVDVNYKAFTHLLTLDQSKLVAQKDNEHPGLLPTSWWRQDKMVSDPHALRLPSGLAPGRYPLVAGMYDPRNGDRLLPLGGQASYVIIGWLVVD